MRRPRKVYLWRRKTQETIKLLNKAHTEFRHRYPGEGPVYVIEHFVPTARELPTTVSNVIRGPGLVTYDWSPGPIAMTAILTSLHVSVIIFVGAFLFAGVERLEPNRRFAIILKCAILAAAGIAIAEQLLPWGFRRGEGYGPIKIPHNLRSTSAPPKLGHFGPRGSRPGRLLTC
jgi:hypothetical protein